MELLMEGNEVIRVLAVSSWNTFYYVLLTIDRVTLKAIGLLDVLKLCAPITSSVDQSLDDILKVIKC